ncbi:MAG: gamma-glutamyl-gamma-aminobutyrate hydrolase family protein [Lachnospiraceae bacterium]|nr:gamma-glutamyl-gamma-aminobutyrate hydrolase family protein [Lachnospiraceae bacterium]
MKDIFIGLTQNAMPASEWIRKMEIAAKGQDFQGIAEDYLRFIEKAGGIPVILPTTDDFEKARTLWARMDGFVLSGGHDVDPSLYGEEKRPSCGNTFPKRDLYEKELLRFAMENGKPVLGICRGIQLINAALGGSDHQDLEEDGFRKHSQFDIPRNMASHTVQLREGSPLEAIFGKRELGVNSFHHQAVKDLAPGLTADAVSEDGVIEALHIPGQPFLLAVQWHPEMMADSEEQAKLAQALIRACRGE